MEVHNAPTGQSLRTIVFAICIISNLSCTAKLLNRPVEIYKSENRATGNLAAWVSTVEFKPGRFELTDHMYSNGLQLALRNAIWNTGMFSKVVMKQKKQTSFSNTDVYLEIKIEAQEKGEIGWYWFFAWPAIYPMPGYWPIQPRSGNVTVHIIANVYLARNKIATIIVSETKHYSIYFYSFYRTAPIEDSIKLCYEHAINRFSNRLQERLSQAPHY